MANITVIETGESVQVAETPRWVRGVWECGDQRFTDPYQELYRAGDEAPAITWDNAPAEYFWIDKGSFFDRFGGKSIVITSSEDPLVRGLITNCMARKYIDLKRADLPVLVGYLKEKGIITDAEMAAVLDPRTTDYERFVPGLPQPAA